ncbi:MAG: tyrosine-type recombinase/integrase [Pyrinomonadaceae bacterium]
MDNVISGQRDLSGASLTFAVFREHVSNRIVPFLMAAAKTALSKGKSSRRPDVVLTKVIQPAARRAGIKKRIGWHTFRHTYSTTLVANGENVKVVQELMRHGNSRCTLDVYSQAKVTAKRDAQQRIVEMFLPGEGLTSEIKLQRGSPDDV